MQFNSFSNNSRKSWNYTIPPAPSMYRLQKLPPHLPATWTVLQHCSVGSECTHSRDSRAAGIVLRKVVLRVTVMRWLYCARRTAQVVLRTSYCASAGVVLTAHSVVTDSSIQRLKLRVWLELMHITLLSLGTLLTIYDAPAVSWCKIDKKKCNKTSAVTANTHPWSTHVQYSTEHYSTVQYSTVQYSTVWYNIIPSGLCWEVLVNFKC